jgi:hypothetical protein
MADDQREKQELLAIHLLAAVLRWQSTRLHDPDLGRPPNREEQAAHASSFDAFY